MAFDGEGRRKYVATPVRGLMTSGANNFFLTETPAPSCLGGLTLSPLPVC